MGEWKETFFWWLIIIWGLLSWRIEGLVRVNRGKSKIGLNIRDVILSVIQKPNTIYAIGLPWCTDESLIILKYILDIFCPLAFSSQVKWFSLQNSKFKTGIIPSWPFMPELQHRNISQNRECLTRSWVSLYNLNSHQKPYLENI